MSDIFIGIDVGGTNIKIGCFDNDMKLLARNSFATNADMGPQAVIEKIAEAVKKLLSDKNISLDNVTAVGLGTPGPAKYKQGILIKLGNLPKFKDVHITKILGDKLGKPIVFDNDANIACYGEFAAGVGKDTNDMVFFTLGTGMRNGIVHNGELLHGCGDNAAELGHMIIYPDGRLCGCGQKGCVEAYASASSTAKRAAEQIEAGANSSLKKTLDEKGEITAKDVYEHLGKGDALAEKVTDETADALAILCVNMLHVTEPEKFVFAGGMIAAGDILLERIRHYFNQNIWTIKKENVEICFATLGEDAGITGAAALAQHACKTGTG